MWMIERTIHKRKDIRNSLEDKRFKGFKGDFHRIHTNRPNHTF